MSIQPKRVSESQLARLRAIASEEIIDELHHLCWIEPFPSGSSSDLGWGCRDHAIIAGGAVAGLGFRCSILEGQVRFVAAQTDLSVPRLMLDVSPHAWLGIDGMGFFDCSPRLASVTEGRCLDPGFRCMWGKTCRPSGAVRVANAAQWESQCERAARDEAFGVVLMVGDGATFVDVNQRVLREAIAFVNSPLTDRLRNLNVPSVYAKAAVHIFKMIMGERASLRSVPQMEAWQIIAGEPGDAVRYLSSRGGFQ